MATNQNANGWYVTDTSGSVRTGTSRTEWIQTTGTSSVSVGGVNRGSIQFVSSAGGGCGHGPNDQRRAMNWVRSELADLNEIVAGLTDLVERLVIRVNELETKLEAK
jgi:hypothetical protein